MKLASLRIDGTETWGRASDDGVHLTELTGIAPSLRDHLEAGGWFDELADADGLQHEIADGELLAPIPRPSKIWCVGLNFDDYRRQLGLDFLQAPNIFLKAPSALCGHDARVGVPDGYGSVFHEWELTAVVGRRLTGASPDEAREAILGFTILDDLTFHEIELVNRDHQQWAKNVDGFAPCGPWIVTRDELPDASNLTMTRRRNGVAEATSSTREMRNQLPELVSFISTFSTLEPGDLVTGGTPPAGPCHAGDEIEGEIEGIGNLRVHLVSRPVDPQWQHVIEGD